MSYNRIFRRTVSCYYSGSETVSYPASEHGGTTTVYYSGTAYEDVEVAIHVDTSSFDISVQDCNDQVNGLTASVGSMNAAQCAAIKKNADKVSKTLIDGFFHTVRTDISTQKAELEQKIEAKLCLLRQQAEALKEKQATMTKDYARTTARYQKIFSDLNNELATRIREIDKSVFELVKNVNTQNDRMLHTDLVQTALTTGKESSLLQAQISAANIKYHALDAMNKAQQFLTKKVSTERAINDATIDCQGNNVYLVPVCFMKTEKENQETERQCYTPEYCSIHKVLTKHLNETLDTLEFQKATETDEKNTKSYVQSEMANKITGDDEHSVRVRSLINNMLNQQF